jgi:thiamine-phosphate pyrophosphorylase
MKSLDLSLYLVTDRSMLAGRDLISVVVAAVRGGVTVVQLREKHASTREFIELARSLKLALSPMGIPLIVNDRLDVALVSGADGIHLGQADASPLDARRLLGPKTIVGLSVDHPDQLAAIQPGTVDYIGASPIFSTPTKTDTASPLGIYGLRELRALTDLPIVAIGGINEGNVGDVMRAGANGIAVVSAICASPDPEAAARRLRERILS